MLWLFDMNVLLVNNTMAAWIIIKPIFSTFVQKKKKINQSYREQSKDSAEM